MAPIVENPFGVHDHDVLSGRGAFVNGHIGNLNFRKLCLVRKTDFDAGNYSEKRNLATEVFNQIKSLDPPGRFLKRAAKTDDTTEGSMEGEWVELSEDKAIHKACQVMRDIARPDRQDGRRRKSRAKKQDSKDSMALLADAGQAAVAEAVAEAEVALDQALDAVPKKDEITAEAQV